MTAAVTMAMLGGQPLFGHLTQAQLGHAATHVHLSVVRRGAIVLSAEQPGEVAYVVVSGTLKVVQTSAGGAEVILGLVGPRDVVGELALIDRGTRSADVVALEDCELLWFDRNAFAQLRQAAPVVMDNLLELTSRRLRLANRQIRALATLDVTGRVAMHLLALADVYGVPDGSGTRIDLHHTQSDLAALCGATRVRVNQSLMGFRKLDLIADSADRRIVILDADGLGAYAR